MIYKTLRISFISLLIILSNNLFAQKIKFSLAPYDAIGIIGGYTLKNNNNQIELGITRGATIHGQFAAYGLSTEIGVGNTTNTTGFSASIWTNSLISLGLKTSYYSDFNTKNAFTIKPMLGLGIAGVQLVYQYDWLPFKPTYNFGELHSLSLRINLGILELNDD